MKTKKEIEKLHEAFDRFETKLDNGFKIIIILLLIKIIVNVVLGY
jgi:hypothetical protein